MSITEAAPRCECPYCSDTVPRLRADLAAAREEIERLRGLYTVKGVDLISATWVNDIIAERDAAITRASALDDLLLKAEQFKRELFEERNALEAALRKYGQHDDSFDDVDEMGENICSCGLDAALAGGDGGES